MSYLTYNLTLNQATQPIGTPTSDNEIANKAYVDTQIISAIDGIAPITNDDLPEDICKTVIGSDTFQGCTVANTFNLGNLTLTDNALTGPSGVNIEGVFINNGVIIEPELRLQSDSSSNSVLTNFSLNSSSLLLAADAGGTVTNSDYLLNNSNENQTQMCFLNFTNLAGSQFYNRVLDTFSGNLNQLDISQFHATGQNPTESITFRLGDTTGGINGNGNQNINVLPTGTEIMKLELTNTTINNNLILNSGQISTTPVNPLDIVNKTYVDSIGGNPFDQDLNTTDNVAFNSIILPSGIEVGSSLDYYKDETINLTLRGGAGFTNSVSVRITRIGNIVTLYFTIEVDTQSSSDTLDLDPIPTWARGQLIQGTLIILDADVTKVGQYQLTSSGVLTVGNIGDYATGPIAMGLGNCGFGGFSVSYNV